MVLVSKPLASVMPCRFLPPALDVRRGPLQLNEALGGRPAPFLLPPWPAPEGALPGLLRLGVPSPKIVSSRCTIGVSQPSLGFSRRHRVSMPAGCIGRRNGRGHTSPLASKGRQLRCSVLGLT